MRQLSRLPDWQLYLDALVSERLHQSFVWGLNDCTIFAADCVLAITGVDLAVGLRGLNAKAACRLIRSSGGMIQLMSGALGSVRGVSQAQPGDVVMFKAGKHDAVAVMIDDFAAAPARYGLMAIPLSASLCSWKVG